MKRFILKNENYYKIMMGLGMVLCILWILIVDTKPFSDFDYYYRLSVDIASGLPWGDTYTSVGYCMLLGGFFKLFGASLFKAKLLNLFLTFASYVSFYGVIKRVNLKERDRKIIFTLFVLMPNNIFYNSLVATELLFTTILIFITFIYFSDIKYKYVYVGILVGLNTLIKPFFILYFFAIFLVELLIEKKIITSIKNSLIILVVCAITIAPWIYRNTKLVGQPTYVSNNGGIVLYINNNSQNKLGRWMPADQVENSIVKTEEYKEANMTQKNKMLTSKAKIWIKSHPIQFIELGFKRLFNTYFWGDDLLYSTNGSALSDSSKAVIFTVTNDIRSTIFVMAIIYILIYSIVILRYIRKGKTQLLNKYTLYNVILFYMFTAVYFVTEGQGRYAFPEIFIMIYCFCYFVRISIHKYKKILYPFNYKDGNNVYKDFS
ncbi:membrane protein, putative [Clostridium carboxidivorans P7]|nr:membrane protein, putative [Clostridium carboxidivorans P7]